MEAYLTYSMDKDVRHRASTGGFCKEFIRYCLNDRIVNKAIITVLGEGKESLTPTTIITDDLSIIMSTKSNTIYDKTNPLSVLKQLGNEKYLFVGLPCHIRPMKLYCERKGISVLTVSLFCNHLSKSYYQSVLDKVGLTKEEVIHFEYRGSGWAGYVKIVTDSGEIKIDHHECWDNYSKNVNMLSKCKRCKEMVSLDADICVGDAWIQSVMNNDKECTCITVAMNNNANQLVIDSCNEGYIHLECMPSLESTNYYNKIRKGK